MKNTTCRVNYSRISGLDPQVNRSRYAGYPPFLRRFPAGNPQRFAQTIPRESTGNPLLFRTICTCFSSAICAPIFRSVFAAIPKVCSRPGRKENGRKTGGGRNLRKTSAEGLPAVERSPPARPRADVHKDCGTWNIRAHQERSTRIFSRPPRPELPREAPSRRRVLVFRGRRRSPGSPPPARGPGA